MSNYRVRQVLALGDGMPRRQLRLLVALATYLDDDSRSVRLGFMTLTEAAGLSVRWMKIARAELRNSEQIAYQPGRFRGELTLWTALCLPEKGAPIGDHLPASRKKGAPIGASIASRKGAPSDQERGHLTGQEGGTLETPDQQESERRLNLQAKSLAETVGAVRADLGRPGRASAAAAVDAARRGPECEHGQPGGESPHPVSGQPICPLCRQKQSQLVAS